MLVRDVLGLPFLTFNIFSMTGLVLVTVLHTFPFVYLLASSALLSVDASYEEAAQILGASKLRTALTITAPLVAPAILSGTLLAFVNAIALFGSQAIIGLPGRIVTLPTRIYALFDYPPEYGLASALSLLFVVITVVALYLQRAFLARRSYVTLAGKGARPQLMQLGPARWLVFGFVVLAFIVAIVLPYSTLIAVSFSKSWGLDFWKGLTLANYKFILFDYNVTQRAILNSLVLATVAATIAVLLGAIIGWIDLRTRIPGRKLLDYVALIPLGPARHRHRGGADPVLAGDAARALRHAGDPAARLCRPLHSARRARGEFIAPPDRSVAGGKRADPRRLLAHHHARGDLPLIRPGLFAGWLLVFVPVIQELSASILLFSSSSITLAVAVYNLYETGYIEPVAALAIINMLIIGAAIFVANKLGGGRIAKPLGRGTRTGVVMASITIKGLTKSFSAGDDAPAAVADLDLDIKDNQFVTLLGPSGCGKTTTLRMIAGYIVPDAGTIHVNGRLLSGARQRRAAGSARHGHGVPELRGVAAQDRVRERRVRPEGAEDAVGGGEEEGRATRSRWSTSTGLEQRYPNELSGGQQQRVALARSLVVEPEILLLDEPLSNLDAKLREQMRVELKRLQRRTGITFVYVTHDQAEALALSDHDRRDPRRPVAAVRHAAGGLRPAGQPRGRRLHGAGQSRARARSPDAGTHRSRRRAEARRFPCPTASRPATMSRSRSGPKISISAPPATARAPPSASAPSSATSASITPASTPVRRFGYRPIRARSSRSATRSPIEIDATQCSVFRSSAPESSASKERAS